MKTTMVTLFAAAMIAATPAVLAQNGSSKTPDQHRHVSKKQVVSGYATKHAMHAKGKQTGHPSAFGHTPNVPTDHTLESSRQAGGGGSM
jgi:Ni/Co efflux regulator RcnB